MRGRTIEWNPKRYRRLGHLAVWKEDLLSSENVEG